MSWIYRWVNNKSWIFLKLRADTTREIFILDIVVKCSHGDNIHFLLSGEMRLSMELLLSTRSFLEDFISLHKRALTTCCTDSLAHARYYHKLLWTYVVFFHEKAWKHSHRIELDVMSWGNSLSNSLKSFEKYFILLRYMSSTCGCRYGTFWWSFKWLHNWSEKKRGATNHRKVNIYSVSSSRTFSLSWSFDNHETIKLKTTK